ncbi:MAG: hypothetical protein HC795_18595 [Coleofasciculaceae cyanobacterium RL_1_1]|nr:hypothetical protein [Coleofasciculaceae cyanobacterium RL_1_1]
MVNPAIRNDHQPDITQHLPLNCDWLTLGSDHLVLMALKQAEDGDRWVLRCYESAGETASFEISGALKFDLTATLDLLERPQLASLDRVAPWRIVSLAFDRQ